MTSPEVKGHTPGPWVRIDKPDYAEIHSASRSWSQAIALVGKPEDANLIAAAPDLLEAVKDAVWFLAHYAEYISSVPVDEIERHPYLPDLHDKIEMLRAAISRTGAA